MVYVHDLEPREDDGPPLPAALLKDMNAAADHGARRARYRLPLSPLKDVPVPSGSSYTTPELGLILWATKLGYREGLEVKR